MTNRLRPAALALLLLAATASLAASEPGHDQLPNIIVIMADDLGYGDVSCYGATELQTPNIDKLAAEGQRFTSGYCSASTCTPTRYSMLTGNCGASGVFRRAAPPVPPTIGFGHMEQS